MKVKVQVQGKLKEEVGSNNFTLVIEEGETIDLLLIKLSRRNPNLVESILDPRTGDLKEEFDIELNGRSIKKIKGLHTRLKNKDEIFITSKN